MPAKMYDYVACLYPEGKINDSHNVLFDDEDIENVLYIGYRSTDEDKYQTLLKEEANKKKSTKAKISSCIFR